MQKIINNLRILRLAFIEELRKIYKDSGVLLILFGAMIAYPVIYSIAYKNNVVRKIPIAVIDLDHSHLSRQAIKMLDGSPQLKANKTCGSMEEAKTLFNEGTVNGIALIPQHFEKKILSGTQANLSIYCDGTYFLLYKETLTGALNVSETLAAGIEIKRLMATGLSQVQALKSRNPLPVKFTTLYNPGEAYGAYVMPGIILVIIQQTLLVGIGMVAGSRKEKFQYKTILTSKTNYFSTFPLLIGKSFAYVVIYIINLLFTQLWVYNWFSYPSKGELLNVMLLFIPYMFAIIFLGLTISTLFSRREHSIMFLVFLSPIIIFISGLSWPFSSLPQPIQWFAYIFPSTTMVPAFLSLRTMGVGFMAIKGSYIILFSQMVFYFITATVAQFIPTKQLK